MQGMELALREAQKALEEGEIAVGAVLMRGDEVLWADHNRREQLHDPTAHAEMLCLRNGARVLGDWRLGGCTLYVTLEPCPMCAGAIINARIPRVVFGAREENTGSCGSVIDLFSENYGHRPTVFSGICAEESRALLQRFFLDRRP